MPRSVATRMGLPATGSTRRVSRPAAAHCASSQSTQRAYAPVVGPSAETVRNRSRSLKKSTAPRSEAKAAWWEPAAAAAASAAAVSAAAMCGGAEAHNKGMRKDTAAEVFSITVYRAITKRDVMVFFTEPFSLSQAQARSQFPTEKTRGLILSYRSYFMSAWRVVIQSVDDVM